MRALLFSLLFVIALTGCTAEQREGLYATVRGENRPHEPFELAPGLFYVGASDVSAYALPTSDGIILIDGGYPSTAPQILANLRTLGLDPADVKILLNTHAHFDHAGGLATLKQETGAMLYASAADTALLEAGGRGDFYLRDWMSYPRVTVDRTLSDGDVVRLGDVAITAHITPGHTKGCTSWSIPVEIEGEALNALLVCSLSVLTYDLTDNPRYPSIADDFAHSFATLRALRCDIPLGTHGHNYDLDRKRAEQIAGAARNPFIDPEGCRAYLDESARVFEARLADQQR